MAGYGRKGYKNIRSRRVVKKRTSGTSSRRRKLQGLDKMTQRAVDFVAGAVPAVKTAYNLYQFAKDARKPGTRTRTQTRTRVKRDTQGGGYNQWSQQYDQKTFGKLTQRKIQKMSMDKVVFTYQNYGAFDNNGQLFFQNYDNGQGTRFYPLMLAELNSINNYSNGTLLRAPPLFHLVQNISTNQMGLAIRGGIANDGVTATNYWTLERGSHTSATSQSYPMENAIHAWSSVDLELWGTINKPTKFSVMLCQFNEDVMFPENITTTDSLYDYLPNTVPNMAYNNAGEFWQSLVKHYSYSPLAKMDDGFNSKKMKILKSYTINIDPTANYENDPDPHVRTLKLFYRFNRKCNFQWKFTNGGAQNATSSAPSMDNPAFQQEDGENQARVHPNARLFLMIRASNFTKITAPAAITNSTSPSMSIKMKSCYLINQ